MKSIVKDIGSMALAFEEDKVLVLFGPKAPQELREISIIHELDSSCSQTPTAPTRLVLDGVEYQIVQMGTQALKNLEELGHISLYFDVPSNDILPGAVYLSPYDFPTLKLGSVIEIL